MCQGGTGKPKCSWEMDVWEVDVIISPWKILWVSLKPSKVCKTSCLIERWLSEHLKSQILTKGTEISWGLSANLTNYIVCGRPNPYFILRPLELQWLMKNVSGIDLLPALVLMTEGMGLMVWCGWVFVIIFLYTWARHKKKSNFVWHSSVDLLGLILLDIYYKSM